MLFISIGQSPACFVPITCLIWHAVRVWVNLCFTRCIFRDLQAIATLDVIIVVVFLHVLPNRSHDWVSEPNANWLRRCYAAEIDNPTCMDQGMTVQTAEFSHCLPLDLISVFRHRRVLRLHFHLSTWDGHFFQAFGMSRSTSHARRRPRMYESSVHVKNNLVHQISMNMQILNHPCSSDEYFGKSVACLVSAWQSTMWVSPAYLQ